MAQRGVLALQHVEGNRNNGPEGPGAVVERDVRDRESRRTDNVSESPTARPQRTTIILRVNRCPPTVNS